MIWFLQNVLRFLIIYESLYICKRYFQIFHTNFHLFHRYCFSLLFRNKGCSAGSGFFDSLCLAGKRTGRKAGTSRVALAFLVNICCCYCASDFSLLYPYDITHPVMLFQRSAFLLYIFFMNSSRIIRENGKKRIENIFNFFHTKQQFKFQRLFAVSKRKVRVTAETWSYT